VAVPALWPVAALAVLLALTGAAFFVSSRRRTAVQVDVTGFKADRGRARATRHAMA